MSHLLYTTRLWWDGRHGLAMLHGRQVPLTGAPAAFAQAEYIDYAPEVRCAQWRPGRGRMREMEAGEIQAANAFLRECCAAPAAGASTDASTDAQTSEVHP